MPNGAVNPAGRYYKSAAALQQATTAWRQQQAAQRGGGFQDIIKQMQAAQEKANLLNEQRYQQVLAQFEGLGKAGRARIEQQTVQRQAAATQALTSRGLGGTTITSAVGRGIAGEAETQRQQLEESVAVRKAGVMERRTDVGPDLGMFANLLQMAGQQQQQPSVIRLPAGGDIFGGGTGFMTRHRAAQARSAARRGPFRTTAQDPYGRGL